MSADFRPIIPDPPVGPTRGNYTDLQPFRFWCQKVLPLVYDDSLSYYEVLCKLVDYLNKTMEDVGVLNDDIATLYGSFADLEGWTSDQVDALSTAYGELQDYVNNYFDNLDVQQEINNKLDALVTDGTMSQLVAPFIPDQVAAWLNSHVDPSTGYVVDNTLSIAGAAADAKTVGDRLNTVNDNLNILNKDVIMEIEFADLNDVKPFYVVSGDTVTVKSKDGSQMTVNNVKMIRPDGTEDYWTILNYTERTISITETFVSVYLSGGTAQDIVIEKDGGTFATKEDFDTLSDSIDTITDQLEKVETMVGLEEVEFTATTGSYIKYNGEITEGSAFSYSDPIPVHADDVIKFTATGYLTEIAMISVCDADGNNIVPKVISTDGNEHTYTYTALVDGYIIVSYATNQTHNLEIDHDKIARLEKSVSTIALPDVYEPSPLNEGFIHRDGRIMSGSNYRYTNPIRLENETISFTATGYADVVSLLSTCDENGDHIVNIVNSTNEEVTKDITFKSDGVTYVIISSSVSQPIVITSVKIEPTNTEFVSLSLFDTFGVVGDSFASGTLFFDSTSKNDYKHSWGQILARRSGTTCTNYSSGGLTTRSWLTDAKGLPLVLTSDPEEIYYLVLGINDAYTLGADYLGSLTDITSHESYTDYGDTFYGNYGRIIEQIMEHAPNAKLVMFTTPHVGAGVDSFNNAIIEIADHYQIPHIVQRNDIFFNSSFYWDNMVQGHPIAITYSGMACAFERLLENCIKNNVEYFKDAFCYPD